jgi:hypothetical protein
MLRNVLVVLCLLTCLGGAEMPKVGDYVAITQSVGMTEKTTVGDVLNISDNFITIEVDAISRRVGLGFWFPSEVIVPFNETIAISTITRVFQPRR